MNYWIGSPQVLCDKVQSYLHLLRRAPPGWRPSVESPAHEQPDAARVRALVMYSSQRGGPQPPHEEATLAGTTCCVKGQGMCAEYIEKTYRMEASFEVITSTNQTMLVTRWRNRLVRFNVPLKLSGAWNCATESTWQGAFSASHHDITGCICAKKGTFGAAFSWAWLALWIA